MGGSQSFPLQTFAVTPVGNRLYTSLAEKLPYFDEVWSADRNRLVWDFRYRINFMLRVRKGNFRIAIKPTFSREYLYGDSVIRISGAVERIGSIGDFSNISPKKKRRSDHWYSTLIPAQLAPLMELRRNAEFMRGLGLTNFLCGIPELPVSFPLPAGFVLPDYYILMPGAGARYRQWTAKNFKELAQRVYKATEWTGITCGGPAEKDLGEKIINGLDIPLQDFPPPRAENRGVTICFEPLAPVETNFVNTAVDAVRFVSQLPSKNFKIILDVKAMCSEGKPIPQIIRDSWPHFGHFHANDKNLKGPGFGEVDFAPIAAALKKVGYNGYVSVEVFNFEEGPEAIATRSVDYLRRVFGAPA